MSEDDVPRSTFAALSFERSTRRGSGVLCFAGVVVSSDVVSVSVSRASVMSASAAAAAAVVTTSLAFVVLALRRFVTATGGAGGDFAFAGGFFAFAFAFAGGFFAAGFGAGAGAGAGASPFALAFHFAFGGTASAGGGAASAGGGAAATGAGMSLSAILARSTLRTRAAVSILGSFFVIPAILHAMEQNVHLPSGKRAPGEANFSGDKLFLRRGRRRTMGGFLTASAAAAAARRKGRWERQTHRVLQPSKSFSSTGASIDERW